jgi:hypothetical protein
MKSKLPCSGKIVPFASFIDSIHFKKLYIMKTQTFFSVLWLLLVLSAPLLAQQPAKGHNPKNSVQTQRATPPETELQSSMGSIYSPQRLAGTPGSAYLDSYFTEGIILMNDGTTVVGNAYRYNLYSQQMEFVNVAGDTVAVANPAEIAFLRMADKVFVYTNYLSERRLKSGYFELLEDGTCRLLKRWEALYHLDDGADQEAFYRDCHCFLQLTGNPAKAMQPKRKNFVNQFGSHQQQLKDYLREHHLKMKDQEDVKKLVRYFNELTQE